MFKLIGDNSREFWQGFTATGITGGTIIFTSNIFFLDLATKVFVAGLIACVGGLGAALASDIYKNFIQKKLFKKKQDEQKKDERAA